MATMEINEKSKVKKVYSTPTAAEWDRVDYDYSTLWRMYDSVDSWSGSSQICISEGPSLKCLNQQTPPYSVN